MPNVFIRIFTIIFCLSAFLPDSSAQPTLSFDLKKPQKFENKKLGSEKTAEKKFTLPRRFAQNTVTHYNWYFNANNRLNEVIARAKASHQDDYTELLSFYNYTLESTSADKNELDSVIYKANAGILIHDLRNSWIDNLYMLMGQAYYFKNQLDSAYLTFQYVNYAFAPKEKDGYDKPIGSHTTEEAKVFSISTKEKTSIPHKAFTTPPSRNESFIWQIKTFLSNDELAEASGLIQTLKTDPVFPERLRGDLYEVEAWWFYKQEIYDSAAVYLEKALINAPNKQEQARWEYLIAQLYERSKKPELAREFYERAVRRSIDPVLEVYGRLNAIRQNKGDSNAIRENLEELLKMGRKDRYTNYRNIIYYTAAQIELERNNIEGAKALLLKSALASTENSLQRTRTFLQLGDLSYEQANYRDAKRFYDSIITTDEGIKDVPAFEKRKLILAGIVQQADIIARQDSLQRLANMSEVEREVFIKKLVRKMRKEQGLKEDETIVGTAGPQRLGPAPATDLFDSNPKGEWYFNNPALKSRGFSEFKVKWGNRPNTDNWRRMTALNQSIAGGNTNPALQPGKLQEGPPQELSYDAMLKNVPLTPELLAVSNDSIQDASIALGRAYMNGLEAYPTVITSNTGFLQRYPTTSHRAEALFQLYYSYLKTGNTARANELLKEIQDKYPGSAQEVAIANAQRGNTPDPLKVDMTRRYDSIYNLFIEGRFEEAIAQKKVADSMYSNNYWTPQLLYIEGVYYVRQRQDEEAKNVLQKITQLYPSSPLSEKANTLLEVLGRRKEIEDYLTNLQVSRPVDSIVVITDTANVTRIPVQQQPPQLLKPDTTVVMKPTVEPKKDTAQSAPSLFKNLAYSFNPDIPHFVVIVLDKVDNVYVTESKNAFNRYNKEKFYNKVIDINTMTLDEQTRLVVMSNFENATAAMGYMEQVRKIAATQIVPWLPVGKYSFMIISGPNLEVLNNKKNLIEYKSFLTQSFPGKF